MTLVDKLDTFKAWVAAVGNKLESFVVGMTVELNPVRLSELVGLVLVSWMMFEVVVALDPKKSSAVMFIFVAIGVSEVVSISMVAFEGEFVPLIVCLLLVKPK